MGAVACGGAGVTRLTSPSGDTYYKVKCKSDESDCLQDARKECGGGDYTVLDSESHAGGVLADALPGPVTWYSMHFKCGAGDGESEPSFAFQGPHYDPSASFAPASPPRRPRTPTATTPAIVGCTSDFACGVGRRCVKPPYSGEGHCADVVDENGAPRPDYMPSGDSVGVGQAECQTLGDCPAGFECKDGHCIR